MKKELISCAVVFFMFPSVNASEKLHVSAIDEFKTETPAKTIDVSVIDTSVLGSTILKSGDVLHCNVVKVSEPKRGKRSANFTVCPISYVSEGETNEFDTEYNGKYSKHTISKEEIKNIDKKTVGKKAALSIGNYFIKGVAPAASMAEGMIKNEEGHVIRSGLKQVYKDSFLSYFEKGPHLTIENGDEFYFIFKPVKKKNKETLNNESNENIDTNESYK